MSKKNTVQKILISAALIGTALYAANEFIIKKATSKNLLDSKEGSTYSFKYGDIFYKVSGEGKPVLLIHDLDECSSGAEWIYLEKKLAETRKVYTIDLLGCGRSEKPKLTYNSFLYVQLISDFIKDVIQEPTDLIATGKSVVPSVLFTKLNEEWIDRLIFINPVDLLKLDEVPDFASKIKSKTILCPIIGTFIYHMLHRKEDIHYKFIKDYFSDLTNHFEEISEYYFESSHLNKSGSKYLYASILGNYLNMNINHGLKVLDKDILIISGEDYVESGYVPEDYIKINENIQHISIVDTAYLPQLEAPVKVLDLIEEYWKTEN